MSKDDPGFGSHDELIREAARGVQVTFRGQVINAGGRQADTTRKAPPAPPEPPPAPPAPPAGLTASEVQALIQGRDELWRERCDSLQAQIDLLSAAARVPRQYPTWKLVAETDDKGRILELVATPQLPTIN